MGESRADVIERPAILLSMRSMPPRLCGFYRCRGYKDPDERLSEVALVVFKTQMRLAGEDLQRDVAVKRSVCCSVSSGLRTSHVPNSFEQNYPEPLYVCCCLRHEHNVVGA